MKTTGLLLLAIVLSAIAFGLWAYMRPPTTVQREEKQQALQIQLTEATIKEETDEFRVDMRYPQFGIPAIDSQIRSYVEDAAREFIFDAQGELVTSAKYELTSTYDRLYIGDGLISARLAISSYMGGAHPNTGIVSLNYELSSGRQLSLDDALALIGMKLEDVAAAAQKELSAKLGEAYFADGATAVPENYATFLIHKDSVTFVFQQYQVAPYAAGMQEVSFVRER